jgi:murein DD-endopeptidase MepM/ murein hydrolase activator NlpD
VTRLGWGILCAIVLAAALFASMLSFGPGNGASVRAARVAPAVPAPAAMTQVGRLPVPVAGVRAAQLTDTWGQSRAGGARAHEAIDIMAPRGTPVLAAAPGRVEKLFLSRDGGNTVYVRSTDGRLVFYYAHLDTYRPGLAEGQAVRRGDLLGTVGSTGNASPEAPHLHFSVKRMAQGEGWSAGVPLNPYPLLVEPAGRR